MLVIVFTRNCSLSKFTVSLVGCVYLFCGQYIPTIYCTHYGRIAYGCCTLDIYFFMGKVKKVKSETDAKVAS